MKILNLTDYNSIFNFVYFTAAEIENQIREYPLSFSPKRDENVEWNMHFPMFLIPFYKFIYLHKHIPRQNEFWEYYLSENQAFFSPRILDNELMDGLKARAFRAYPSLVRDIHFLFYLKSKFHEATILYNTKLDIGEGIDLLVTHKDKYWGINLYADTQRAHKGREKKEFRHTKFDNVAYVELPVQLRDDQKSGQFFLYGARELNQIKSIVDQ